MIGKTISHYRILEKLGQGGMGVVYKAEDTKLQRTVAIKFLPPEITRDPEAKERFTHEARAASALEHHNICNIHEIDETKEGQTFMVMACYEGESLDDKIERGPLKVDEAVDIASQISQGLNKAHEKGIVHRDIKPANILITDDGVVKILDFGLAKLRGQTKLTKEGTTLGTVAYMSPEQSRGEEVDHRTDIWSLGVVLYEMLTGQTPFRGDYEQAVVYSILNEGPEPVSGLRTGVPIELEGIIAKTLAKNPQERYQHIDELAVDLQRIKKESTVETLPSSRSRDIKPPKKHHRPLLIGVLVFVIIIITVLAYLNFNKPQAPKIPSTDSTAGRKWQNSIAVLPFENMSADPDQEYFCDGMAEEIISALSHLKNLRVIARTSTFAFKGKHEDVREIGKKLDVETLLEGSVRKSDNQIRITAQLIKVSDGSHLWSEKYDRDMEDIFEIQDEISGAIVDAMKMKLIDEEKASVQKRHTENLEAYDLYMRGRFFWNKRTSDDIQKAIEYFEKAIEHDPNNALAYTGLADAYSILPWYGSFPPKEAKSKAMKAALKALDLDDELAEAHASLGLILKDYENDYEGAEKEFLRAIELNPGYASAHQWYSSVLGVIGKPEESMREIEIAFKLDPLSIIIHRNLATHKLAFWDLKGAEEIRKRALEIEPDNAMLRAEYSITLTWAGKIDESLAEIRYAMKLDSSSVWVNESYGRFLIYTRQYDKAIEQLKKTIKLGPSYSLAHANLGAAYLYKEMYEEALAEYSREDVQSIRGELPIRIIYGRMGKKEKVRELIEEREKQPENSYVQKFKTYVSPYDMATLYNELGEQEQMFKWLDKAYQEHDAWLMGIKFDPLFDNCRNDPRYIELLKKIGLDP